MSELAMLTDSIEIAGVEDLYGGAPDETKRAAGVGCQRVGGASIATLRHVKSAVYSRVIGLGLDGPVSEQSVARVIARLSATGAPRAFVHVSPYALPAELSGWLSSRGLTRYPRGWMRFVREREPAPDARSDLSVRDAVPDDAARVDEVVREAFELPDAARGLYGAAVGRPRWHVFVATDAGRVVASGGLFVHGDVGWFGFGAVAKESRRRGAQSALIRARIERALELGCRVLFSETGEAVPGDPQHSYNNLLRAGFREAFLRQNWLLA